MIGQAIGSAVGGGLVNAFSDRAGSGITASPAVESTLQQQFQQIEGENSRLATVYVRGLTSAYNQRSNEWLSQISFASPAQLSQQVDDMYARRDASALAHINSAVDYSNQVFSQIAQNRAIRAQSSIRSELAIASLYEHRLDTVEVLGTRTSIDELARSKGYTVFGFDDSSITFGFGDQQITTSHSNFYNNVREFNGWTQEGSIAAIRGHHLQKQAADLAGSSFEVFGTGAAFSIAANVALGEKTLTEAAGDVALEFLTAKGGEALLKVVEKTNAVNVVSRKVQDLKRGWCFAAGTLIHAETGLKPIEEIKVGERVWSRSEHNVGEPGWRKVTESACTGESELWDVEVQTPDGRSERYLTTELHPFWVASEGEAGQFVAAGELKPGDELRLGDGAPAYIVNVKATGQTEPVYNFTVEGFHTYHVGELGVWVHNDMCLDGLYDTIKSSGMSRQEFDRLAEGWSKGSFDTVADSIIHHANRHGDGDVARYLRAGGDIQAQISARARGWKAKPAVVHGQGGPNEYTTTTWDGPNGRFAIIDDTGMLRTWGKNT